MNIATEITRLQTAKEDIRTAIEEKGVEVGDGTLDTYAGKIAEITVGGGDDIQAVFGTCIQNNGTRTDYQQAFRNWNNLKTVFRPQYDIKPPNANYIFYASTGESISLPELSNELGIVFDFSGCTTMQYAFSYAAVTDVGYLDLRNCTNGGVTCLFLGATKVETAHIRTKDNGALNIGLNAFNYAYGMKNLTIEGKIAEDFNIEWSDKLTAASMKSIINALDDYSNDFPGEFAVNFNANCWDNLEKDHQNRVENPEQYGERDLPEGYDSWRSYVEIGKGWDT